MRLLLIGSFAIGLSVALTPAAFAKAKKKASNGAVTGVYCAQGPDNVFIGISQFKPHQRKGMRKGQKAKINIAGFGPIDCVVR